MVEEIEKDELQKHKARQAKKTVLRDILKQMTDEATMTDQLVSEIIGDSGKELDDFIDKIERILERIRAGRMKNFSEVGLELLCLELPTIMYKLNERVEDLAGRGAVAASYKKEAFDRHFAKMEGTIPDKTNATTLHVTNEILAEKLIERARVRLKSRLERGLDLFSALKKVMDSRRVAMEVWRRELPMYDTVKPGDIGEIE